MLKFTVTIDVEIKTDKSNIELLEKGLEFLIIESGQIDLLKVKVSDIKRVACKKQEISLARSYRPFRIEDRVRKQPRLTYRLYLGS